MAKTSPPSAPQAWNEPVDDKGKVPPRVCVANARDALDRAFGTQDQDSAVRFMLGATDWLRRALEQMVGPGGSHSDPRGN